MSALPQRERPPCEQCPDEAIAICKTMKANECTLFNAYVGNHRAAPTVQRDGKEFGEFLK